MPDIIIHMEKKYDTICLISCIVNHINTSKHQCYFIYMRLLIEIYFLIFVRPIICYNHNNSEDKTFLRGGGLPHAYFYSKTCL